MNRSEIRFSYFNLYFIPSCDNGGRIFVHVFNGFFWCKFIFLFQLCRVIKSFWGIKQLRQIRLGKLQENLHLRVLGSEYRTIHYRVVPLKYVDRLVAGM